jgi:hypothetical protein
VHANSRSTYKVRRVRAELELGRGISASHGAVEMLMRQAGITGITGRPKWRHAKPDNIARDLACWSFTRTRPASFGSERTGSSKPPRTGRSEPNTASTLQIAIPHLFGPIKGEQRRSPPPSRESPIDGMSMLDWE